MLSPGTEDELCIVDSDILVTKFNGERRIENKILTDSTKQINCQQYERKRRRIFLVQAQEEKRTIER